MGPNVTMKMLREHFCGVSQDLGGTWGSSWTTTPHVHLEPPKTVVPRWLLSLVAGPSDHRKQRSSAFKRDTMTSDHGLNLNKSNIASHKSKFGFAGTCKICGMCHGLKTPNLSLSRSHRNPSVEHPHKRIHD